MAVLKGIMIGRFVDYYSKETNNWPADDWRRPMRGQVGVIKWYQCTSEENKGCDFIKFECPAGAVKTTPGTLEISPTAKYSKAQIIVKTRNSIYFFESATIDDDTGIKAGFNVITEKILEQIHGDR